MENPEKKVFISEVEKGEARLKKKDQ